MSGSRGLRAAIVAAAIGGAFVVAGCGSGDTKPTTTSSANSNGPVSITVTSPTNGSVVGAESVTVHGTVTPATAKVEIDGHSAAAGNGAFACVASLHPGQNTLNIITSAPGQAPGTTTLVLIRQTSGSTGTTEAHHGETATAITTRGVVDRLELGAMAMLAALESPGVSVGVPHGGVAAGTLVARAC